MPRIVTTRLSEIASAYALKFPAQPSSSWRHRITMLYGEFGCFVRVASGTDDNVHIVFEE